MLTFGLSGRYSNYRVSGRQYPLLIYIESRLLFRFRFRRNAEIPRKTTVCWFARLE